MRAYPFILLIFIGIPLIEVYLFIEVGEQIGALPTVLLCITTALIGSAMVRAQGISTMAKFQQEVATGQMPAATMMEGFALMLGGILLITPGFFTDAIGFLCLIPYTRRAVISRMINNMVVTGSGFSDYPERTKPKDPNVIEGEFRKNDDEPWGS
ncbi:MAG: FxsA family protein [Pseudomonadota bacterium]